MMSPFPVSDVPFSGPSDDPFQSFHIVRQFVGARHASCRTDYPRIAPAQVAKNQATRLDFTSSPDNNRSSCSGLISIAGLPVRGNRNSPRSSRL